MPVATPTCRSSRRSRRGGDALAVLTGAIVALAGLGAGPVPTTAAGQAMPMGPVTTATLPPVRFYGRGYGHGVGMSQYGAHGRALVGQLAPAILAHYYAGTTTGTRDAATIVRVLVLTGFAATPAAPMTIVGLGGRWSIDGIPRTFLAKARLTLAPTATGATTWALKVLAPTGTVLHHATVSGAVIVRPASALGVLQLASKASTSNVYRGSLAVRLTTTAIVVNHVGVDAYLRGVVPVEMPASWPVEALKVQAIAARSYALHAIHPTTGTFDLYDDTRSQVYRGQKGENPATDAAIAATGGQVLLSGTTVANTLFHSADGGWTENNENVFVSSTGAIVAGPVSYLRGSSDRAPDGSSYDKSSPYATWSTATYTNAQLSAFFATDPRTNVGTISKLDLSRRGVSRRLISVTLVGSLGTKTMSGDVFRSVFNTASPVADPPLRGNLFDIAPIP
ncbi:MAG TPA: SpoIID/LytB domain-containing protein [Candidatus Limnocylindrales bacterium]|nr:SpoIID/LytB domain-containing protein [Candidatus Limnocylindrales bacterium]